MPQEQEGAAPDPDRPRLSVVTTVYRSRQFLESFLAQVADAVAKAELQPCELIFVIDGPTDDSVELLRAKRAEYPGIRVIELSRNFGHHAAILCGLRASRGDLVFLIDCDLEVSPSVLPEFWDLLRQSGADVVYGFQETRKGGWLQRTLGGAFWRIFNALSDTRVPVDVLTERLMTRRYVEALASLEDRNLFLAGMMYWTGFLQIGTPVKKRQRETRTAYTFFRRLALAVDAVTSFSSAPLRTMFSTGMVLVAGCLIAGFILLAQKIIYPETILAGFASLIIIQLFLCGIVLFCTGLLGIYVAKIFRQTQGRPTYIVKEELSAGEKGDIDAGPRALPGRTMAPSIAGSEPAGAPLSVGQAARR